MQDVIVKTVLELIENSDEVYETKEIQMKVSGSLKDVSVTRVKLMYRLNNLRGDGLINGKMLGAGKGVWIWWKKEKEIFPREKQLTLFSSGSLENEEVKNETLPLV